jgi:hypothetical protein
MRRTLLLAMASLLALAGSARASDPVGIYALVEKVVLEPSEGKPERAQVWGVFRLAKPRAGGDEYQKPAHGYLYYSLASGKEDETRREWADLKEVAGTGQVIAFSGRYEKLGRVRKAAEKVEKPDPYPAGVEMYKLNGSKGMAKELRALALPQQPADGGEVEPGAALTLRAHRIADTDRKSVKYLFELTNPAGDKETSDPVAVGSRNDLATWSPKTPIQPGEEYHWRVWAVDGDWKGEALTSSFKGKTRR